MAVSEDPSVSFFLFLVEHVLNQNLINSLDAKDGLADVYGLLTNVSLRPLLSAAVGVMWCGVVQIEVVFTSNGESADMYVERLTEELKDAGCPNVMVSSCSDCH